MTTTLDAPVDMYPVPADAAQMYARLERYLHGDDAEVVGS
jgi:hypothetical protein